MILVSFFFSHRALSIGIGRDGIGLKVGEIAQRTRRISEDLGRDRRHSEELRDA